MQGEKGKNNKVENTHKAKMRKVMRRRGQVKEKSNEQKNANEGERVISRERQDVDRTRTK